MTRGRRISFRAVVGIAAFGCLISGASAQNLFLNPGFEDIPGSASGQGILPSNWVQVMQSADTYSNDGSFGLFPGEFGNFPGVTAHGGLRWVAGANINQVAGGEQFAQTFSSPLVAGALYRVDGWMHQALRFDLNNPGGYDLWLDKGDFNNRLLVGHIGDTSSPTAGWNLYSDEFTAPANAAEYTRFVFAPIAIDLVGTYPGIDDVSLTAVPEPASLAAVAIGIIGLRLRPKRTTRQ